MTLLCKTASWSWQLRQVELQEDKDWQGRALTLQAGLVAGGIDETPAGQIQAVLAPLLVLRGATFRALKLVDR